MIREIKDYNEMDYRKLVAKALGVSIFDIPCIQSVTEIERFNVKTKEVDKVELVRYWKGGRVRELEF